MSIEEELEDLWCTASDEQVVETMNKLVEMFNNNPIIREQYGCLTVSPALYARIQMMFVEGPNPGTLAGMISWDNVKVVVDENLGI